MTTVTRPSKQPSDLAGDAPDLSAGMQRPARRHPSATRRLVTTELRLMGRDPLTLTFSLVFPIISMLIIGGSFGTQADDAFPVDPTQWYVASYFTVVIGATGLVMMPVHLASYRERGVLRRFAAAGFPRWSFALAELVLGLTAVAASGAVLLAVAAPVYGVPAPAHPGRVGLGVVVGAVTFISIGILLGSLLPSARAAQAIGLVVFFPSFLLGVGGPPPAVLSPTLRRLADVLPLKLITDAIRDPWLGLDDSWTGLVVVAVLGLVALALAARRTSL